MTYRHHRAAGYSGIALVHAGTVSTWEQRAAGTSGGFGSSKLSTGSWPSPACPEEEGFTAWPAMFTPLAYDSVPGTVKTPTASDDLPAEPFTLQAAPVTAGTQALALRRRVRCRPGRRRAGRRTRPYQGCRRPVPGTRRTPRTGKSPCQTRICPSWGSGRGWLSPAPMTQSVRARSRDRIGHESQAHCGGRPRPAVANESPAPFGWLSRLNSTRTRIRTATREPNHHLIMGDVTGAACLRATSITTIRESK